MLLRVRLQHFDHLRIVLLLSLVLKYRPADSGQLTRPSLRNPMRLQLDRRLAALTGF
jgi:hypothetical protein